MTIEPIGVIHTPFNELQDMPIQPKGSANTIGKLLINRKYVQGLKDLDEFSHIYVIYYFHQASRTELTVTPFMDVVPRGVFSTRSPLRPSHIGMSLTKIVSVIDNIITIEGVDILDGTPLLDIKPYIPQFEDVSDVRTGWMNKSEDEITLKKSDSRFI